MAQADGVVANGTGSAVRSDINGQYAALWSNHSGSTEPSSGKVAYQFWADTNTNILKIRNSSNNGWINLFTLAGGVDVDAASNFNEDVTFTGASYNLVWDKSDNALEFADNAKCTFGAGDLKIYHNGSHSYIQDSGTGELRLASNQFTVQNAAADETLLYAVENGAVGIKFDDSLKFETTSSGTKTTGQSVIDGDVQWNGSDGTWGAYWDKSANIVSVKDDAKIGFGTSNDLQIYHDGSNSFINNTTGEIRTNDTWRWDDSAKATFGYSNDLQIYHSGTNSYISEEGTGHLILQSNGAGVYIRGVAGEESIIAASNQGVRLHYNNELVFQTEGDGASIWNTDGDAVLKITASEANAARILMQADDGDDNNDKWNLISHEDGYFAIQSFSGGAWTTHVYLVPEGKSALSYNNSIKMQTTTTGITVTGTVNETSDIALKENIQPLSNSLVNLKQLNGYSYKFKDTEEVTGAKSLGLTAQEVEKVYPDLVEGEEGEKTLQYSGLIAPLLEAVKELSTKIDTLETKVAVLEAK